MKDDYFPFAADCRHRFEYPIPATYVGNWIARCVAVLKRKELKGEGGFVNAVKSIVKVITDTKTEPLRGAENWNELKRKIYASGSVVGVTGSPKFPIYETDFGFGKPVKVDRIHSCLFVSLVKSGDKEGGIEFGFVFGSGDFEYFNSVIEKGVVTLKS